MLAYTRVQRSSQDSNRDQPPTHQAVSHTALQRRTPRSGIMWVVKAKSSQVADAIEAAIARGTYAPKAKLPSVADLMAEHGVSNDTAMRALRELRDRGLIETVPYVGSFVAPAPAARLSLEERVTRLEKWRAQTEGRLASDQAADPEAPS